jgi:hypothetical protein
MYEYYYCLQMCSTSDQSVHCHNLGSHFSNSGEVEFRDQVPGECRKLYEEQLHNLYYSLPGTVQWLNQGTGWVCSINRYETPTKCWKTLSCLQIWNITWYRLC